MSNIKGELELDFAGKKRKFKLDFMALTTIETRLGKPLLQITNDMAAGNIGMTNMAIILDEALKSGGGKYTFEAVGNLIMQNGFTKSFEIVSKLVQDLMDAKETTDPKEEQKNQEQQK